MQFTTSVAVATLAATVAAWGSNATSVASVAYVTEVFTAYTTYCPASTTLSFNGITYTVTDSTTLTITNCPCTVIKPVTTSSAVAVPTTAPVYANTTTAAPTKPATSVGTTSVKSSPSATPPTITASGGNKVVAMSGASLAGLLGLAAYFL